MKAAPTRIYADSAVYGGVFDAEFATASAAFFQEVREGRHILVSSALVQDELAPAPDEVRALFAELLPRIEFVDVSPAAYRLREAYLKAGIVGASSMADALHVGPSRPSRNAASSSAGTSGTLSISRRFRCIMESISWKGTDRWASTHHRR